MRSYYIYALSFDTKYLFEILGKIIISIPASLSKTFLDEHHSDPVGHGVCAGTSEVPVDDDDGDEDADGVHDEGEEEILGDEGQHEGGGGQDLGDEQQEHNQRQQNADPEGHLTQSQL